MQLVKYKWATSRLSGEPFLFARDHTLRKIKLFDQPLSMKLGKRTCTGYVKNGRSHECPSQREIKDEKVCNECALNDDFFLCMKCDGEECINESQRRGCGKNNYYIYLAAFSSMLKVGISYEPRVLERLIEQGADMGAKICMVTDGKLARQLEQKIRKDLGIRDRVSGFEKQRMLFGSPNSAALNILNAYNKLKSNSMTKYLIRPEIYNLQPLYRLSELKGVPKPLEVKEGDTLNGSVVAAKGNIIVFRDGDDFFSVNAHRLIGHQVELL